MPAHSPAIHTTMPNAVFPASVAAVDPQRGNLARRRIRALAQVAQMALVVLCVASGMWAAEEVDLASDGAGSATGTEWTLSIDGGPARPIKVPAGGWNSDLQSPRIDKNKDVKDHVIYERKITIPDYKGDRVVKLMFGAVNHGAEVYLNDKLVATHAGPMTPFEADITDIVKPGATCQLKVKAYHRRHYKGRVPIGFDYPSDKPGQQEAGYTSKFAYGMTKYVKLAIFPQVYIKDVFVRPSVTNDNLQFDVWVYNAAPNEKALTLEANLTSWNKDSWAYPVVAGTNVKIEPKSVKKITVGPVQWGLGSKSYWWPNIPFDETYTAKLHLLNLSIKEGQVSLDKRSQRFGFCDYAEGPYYYTINGVRVNNISDATAEGQMSYYDCYSMAPAFLPPTGPKTGCPETWRRYMRAGMNANRIHQSMPTGYMMDAADEVGFMLIPEPGIRGHDDQGWDDVNLPQAIKEMAWLCRNHPCVIRYSLGNEMYYDSRLLDPIFEEDARRPLVFEGSGSCKSAKGHALLMAHYSDYPRPARAIFGMGEFAWSNNGPGKHDGMALFADQGRDMRLNDVCYFAGWSWMNWWPNFLEGMDFEHHGWLLNRHADRRDGTDGWGSHIIQHVQRSCHPYLVMDHAIETMNRYNTNWPTTVETIMPGEDVVRKIEMFNDVLSGNRLALRWTLHWDSAAGESVASETIKDIAVEPGFHVTQTLKFKVPDPGKDQRKLFIVLESLKQDSVVYKEDRNFVNVSRTAVKPDVKFIGIDRKTQGDWQKKYGTEGHETIGKETKLPGYAKLEWSESAVYVLAGATTDVRALTYFANPLSEKDRIVAIRYAKTLKLTLDVGASYHNIAIYMLDLDRKKRKQSIEMLNNGAMVLDTQTVDDFTEGKYLIWRIRGKVLITLKPLEGDNVVISGVFFDPPER